jgi:PDDEXK-like domain of unknown function (DUF3799)
MGEWTVTAPGIVDGMPAETYHADPVPGGSLSSSGARQLLPPSCPAKYKAARDAPTKAMERGTAAHTLVLGTGPGLHVVKAADWRTAKAKDEAEEARFAGLIPVLEQQAAELRAMAAALTANPKARLLLAPGSGRAEQSLFWHDGEFGVWRRARLDHLPHGANGLCIIPDYKTSGSADPEAVQRTIARFGYHLQADWYCAAVEALRPGVEARFVLIVQETDPPWLAACYQFDRRTREEGARRNRQALEIYRDCTTSGLWPGYDDYDDDIATIGLPGWAFRGEEW